MLGVVPKHCLIHIIIIKVWTIVYLTQKVEKEPSSLSRQLISFKFKLQTYSTVNTIYSIDKIFTRTYDSYTYELDKEIHLYTEMNVWLYTLCMTMPMEYGSMSITESE